MNRKLCLLVVGMPFLLCAAIALASQPPVVTSTSIKSQGTSTNPVPTITSLSPSGAYVDSAGFTLTINGTGFVSSSIVYWSNAALTTTYESTTQITAQVPASYLTYEGTAYVQVWNPAPGGGYSADVYFQIVALDPSISGLSPDALVSGTAATSIIVEGDNFMTGATVLWNGRPLSTTYVNEGELQAQLSAAELSKPTIAQVSVSNPRPGGVSSVLDFNVTYAAAVRILNLPANDLVWNPATQQIYASLPSSYGPNGNSIAVIDPAKGSIIGYHFAGSEPGQMAISADGSYLYVGLNGDGSVQRLILPSFSLDINVSLGTSEYGGVNTAGALGVSPADSHTFAVSIGNSENCCGGGGPLEFFTDTTLLSNSISYPAISAFQFASATTLYGYSDDTLSQVTVNSSGGTLTTQWNDLLTGSGGIQYDAGLIYGSGGQVMNPTTGELVGSYDVGESCCSSSNDLLAESTIGRTFFAGVSPFFSSLGITSYNLSEFTPIAVINLSQLGGSVAPTFISWGTNGLAFVLETGCCESQPSQVVLVQSEMMEPPPGHDKP